MKKNSENNNLISEDKNYLRITFIRPIRKNIKKCISVYYILFLIFIPGILIASLYYAIKILYIKKISINQKQILKGELKEIKKEEVKNSDNSANIISNSIVYINSTLEQKDLTIFHSIESSISQFIEQTIDEQKFIFRLLREIKPKKIVEIGVAHGGSSALILNAIKDIVGAKLYSLDKSKICYRNRNKTSGYIVNEKFPELINKWYLFLGGITAEFMETISDGIDLAFIDTMHITPGEMLDFLMVLPFLKNEAIIVLHDAFFLYAGRKVEKTKKHTSNNQILCYARGNLILPNYGDKVFFRNIGAIKLSPQQKQYYYQYFLALGIQWEYMPEKKDLKIMRDFFMKYYGEKYVEVFDDAVEKNRIYLNK